ncbi:MAG: amino acid permease [bacterium]
MKNKITLFAAILINLNTILGAGIFINPGPLTNIAQSFGFLSYFFSMLILMPIVLSVAELAQLYPTSGGLYVYSRKYISPMTGFISGWGYFVGKATAAALLCNVVVMFLQRRILFLQNFSLLFLDFLMIFSLIGLNILGAKIGGRIQYLFAASKFIPILVVIFSGIFFVALPETPTENIFTLISSSIPIAIFALTSFEVICSIGHMIENPQKNIKKAILISFGLAVLFAISFQLIMYSVVGPSLAYSVEPLKDFGLKIFSDYPLVARIISALVMGSILGGAFSSLTTNSWNVYKFAEDNFIPFKNFFIKVNDNGSAWAGLLFEGLIAIILLIITKQQIPLQSMAVFGVVSCYLFSSTAALFAYSKKKAVFRIIPILAILSSSYVLWLCLKKLYLFGISFSYLSIFLGGILIALFRYKKN